jgi:translation elongation factor EF-Ts
MVSPKIDFIKKIRERLDVSMQTAIEYYNTYDADLEKSLEMLKNDFITKIHPIKKT